MKNTSNTETASWFANARPLWGTITIISAIATLILAACWANSNAAGFLTIPSWKTNLFAWHPILMTSGFFFSQVMAVLPFGIPLASHNVLPSVLITFWPLIWNSAAMGTMLAGLYAVFKYRANLGDTHLATIHEWTGILIAILFGLNYILNLTFIVWGGE